MPRPTEIPDSDWVYNVTTVEERSRLSEEVVSLSEEGWEIVQIVPDVGTYLLLIRRSKVV